MATTTARRLRYALVADLQRRGCIRSRALADAFRAIPREAFVPAIAERDGLAAVYRDDAIPTKHDAAGRPTSSSSQPAIMALMLERLDVQPGQRVLEIGTGTGYNAALLRELVGLRGTVVSVELDADVANAARRALRKVGRRAAIVVGDGHDGAAAGAPYDRIVVTASTPVVPLAWRDQLVEGGLVEAPLRLRETGPHAIATLRRDGDRLTSVSVLCGGFMPLRGPAAASVSESSLSASAATEAGSIVLADIRGAGVSGLSHSARRRLLALVLAGPRSSRSVRPRADGWPLALYLALELPARRVVESWPEQTMAIGVVDGRGSSVALVSIEPPDGARRAAAANVLAFGEQEAEEILEAALARWVERGRPNEDALRVAVSFGDGFSRIRHSWAQR